MPSLEFSPQAPGSNIENLESHMRQHTTASLALTKADAYVEALKRPPEFKTPLINIGIEEGEYCRFETQVAPVNDPYMKVEWFKDKKPVLIGINFFARQLLYIYIYILVNSIMAMNNSVFQISDELFIIFIDPKNPLLI